MEQKSEIREFLTSRRARLTPDRVGLPIFGGSRRVPGLRREEVALLAGVSVDYYTRLERGNLSGVSDSVLEALARALQLDEAERAHLFDLARAAHTGAPPRRRRPARQKVRPSVQLVLDAITDAPAFVRNGRFDVLAANDLARALYRDLYDGAARPVNLARHTFLDPRSRAFYDDWEEAASGTAAFLRSEAGRDPFDRDLSDLVGELSTQSDVFRTLWASHDVRFHHSGLKHFHDPAVGELKLRFEALELAADSGLTLLVYAAEPGSRSAEGLKLLGSLAATPVERAAAGQPPT
ncbi:helix-turn-helix transcriptional regulator [Conexibacter stalactiti]|uniref:Helix-turn-helix transcriptional regulator n=1 Tax=Conexibacter stalactiti TaxID=1940611 RepID=A0ABU4HRV7_9ACTN|nr:helix-turn-helix transcriptional regulator [Conexibacter stalactiti]MDW5596008.1 helix-turn-helix transcriptional regulator [Conexibacter stalactiti]MEC5036650.1 helix-turn-helix transcriptional regulator [Conexibacter stalactiti]